MLTRSFSRTLQTLNEDEPERYQSHFSEYLKRGIEADAIEELLKKVHAAIRADPSEKKSEKQPPKEHKRLLSFPTIDLFVSPPSNSLPLKFLTVFVPLSFQIQSQEADL